MMTTPLAIWLVTTGEPLESDGESIPLLQTGRFSKFVARRGHDVTWWTSRFNHRTKRQRPEPPDPRAGAPLIRLIDSPGYARNVSFQRMWDHRIFATNFLDAAQRSARPDIIVAALPPVDLAAAAVRAAQALDCPVIVDVRDQWPDLIVDHAPAVVRPLARLALRGMNQRARFAFANATAITGITQSYVEWGLAKAERAQGPLDQPFPISREVFDIEWTEPGSNGRSELRNVGVDLDAAAAIACFVGTLGRQFDIPTVLDAARLLRDRSRPVRFVIAGEGESRERYQQESAGLPNVTFTGHLSRAATGALLKAATVGIAPYIDIKNFRDNVPNKIVEYLSAGLPFVTPLSGEVAALIDGFAVGLRYTAESSPALAAAIERFVVDPDLRRLSSENASRLFLERFQADVVHRRLAEYLEAIAVRRRNQGSAA